MQPSSDERAAVLNVIGGRGERAKTSKQTSASEGGGQKRVNTRTRISRPKNSLRIPCGYHDNTDVWKSFEQDRLREIAAKTKDGRIKVLLQPTTIERLYRYSNAAGVEHTMLVIVDPDGRRLRCVAPDRALPLERYIERRCAMGHCVYLRARPWIDPKGELLLLSPEPVAARWVGAIEPIYPVEKQTLSAQIRAVSDLSADSYLAMTRAQSVIRHAYARYRKDVARSARAVVMRDVLKSPEALYAALGRKAASQPDYALDWLFQQVHAPSSLEQARWAQERIQRIAVVERIEPALRERMAAQDAARNEGKTPRLRPEQCRPSLREYARRTADGMFEFQLTESQMTAVEEALEDMNSGAPMQRILSGDVGSGKTPTFSVVAKIACDAGMRVAIINPTEQLAEQTYQKVREWIGPATTGLCTATRKPHPKARVVVGTVALCSRYPGRFDLVIVDEQQRYSRLQREIVGREQAHKLEVSATCIPRSMALIECGMLSVSQLEGCHVDKTIMTRIWEREEKDDLFDAICESVAAGDQVLIIHPARSSGAVGEEDAEGGSADEAGIETRDDQIAFDADRESESALLLAEEDEEPSGPSNKNPRKSKKKRSGGHGLMSVEDVAASWDRAFPGKVRVSHGGMSSEDNANAIAALHKRKAQILITTTLVEVGLDIPGIKRVVIMQADRFGVATIHQLRGRAARAGGTGYCDLYLTGEPTDKSRQRLENLVECNDGWELALADMQQRGGGDLSIHGNRQSGKRPKGQGTLLDEIDPSPAAIEQASTALRHYLANGVPDTDRLS